MGRDGALFWTSAGGRNLSRGMRRRRYPRVEAASAGSVAENARVSPGNCDRLVLH